MFCPKCRTEYAGDVARCPTCGVELVAGAPPAGAEWVEFVPILETTDETRLAVAKSLLAAEGVPFMVQGEEGQELIAAGPSRLCVRPEDTQAARELLAHLEPLDEDTPTEG